MEPLTADSPIRTIFGVGPSVAGKLDKLGIQTVHDLLYHIPFRYNDFSLVSTIAQIQPGETVTVAVTVEAMKGFVTKTRKRIQEAMVTDNTGKLSVIWFNQQYLLKLIKQGDYIRLSGKVDWFGRKIVMYSPVFEIVSQEREIQSIHTGRLVPVYAETEGLTSKWIRAKIHQLIPLIVDQIIDPIPQNLQEAHGIMPLVKALRTVHFPQSTEDAKSAKQRLAFDELFALLVRAYLKKRHWQTTKRAHTMAVTQANVSSLLRLLPFELTKDQTQAVQEVLADIEKPIPMNRLLEGDVGSGKTVVAAIAMYAAFANGFQTVLMAPTQILAQQHYETISQLLSPLKIRVDIVTAQKKTIDATSENQQSIFANDNHAAVVVGTHALLAHAHALKHLGLVVVDEQHRFGVEQRSALLAPNASGHTPHLLTMTATPIPRTMAKTIFGNLDLSVLSESPKGRQRIKTWVVPKEKRDAAYEWIRKELTKTNSQAYVVCPLIDESDDLSEVKAATSEFDKLKKIYKDFTVGLLHGKLKPTEKTAVLNKFRAGDIRLLTTTPVVEVGIDVPNATVMLIEAADRFGLGQLHQLRGRVGRSSLQSYCLLFTEATEESAIARLKAMETMHSGPLLAELDLTLRGTGQLFGTRQHGASDLKIASYTDTELIRMTKKTLDSLIHTDPDLTRFPHLRQWAKKSTIEPIVND